MGIHLTTSNFSVKCNNTSLCKKDQLESLGILSEILVYLKSTSYLQTVKHAMEIRSMSAAMQTSHSSWQTIPIKNKYMAGYDVRHANLHTVPSAEQQNSLIRKMPVRQLICSHKHLQKHTKIWKQQQT